jgi:hypothetical protein
LFLWNEVFVLPESETSGMLKERMWNAIGRIHCDMLQNVWQKQNVASMYAQPGKEHTFYLYKGGSLFTFA